MMDGECVTCVGKEISWHGFGRPSRIEDDCKTGLKETGICGKN